MWSMTGAVGQRFFAPSAGERLRSNREAARRDAESRPAGRQSRTRSTSRIYFVTLLPSGEDVALLRGNASQEYREVSEPVDVPPREEAETLRSRSGARRG